MEILRACPFLLAAAVLLASVGRSAEEAGSTGPPSAPFPGISAAKREPSPAPAAGRMRLSMNDAVTGALETAQRIGEARAAYERSDAAVLQAFSGALPSLSANASFTRTRGPLFGGRSPAPRPAQPVRPGHCPPEAASTRTSTTPTCS